jgi:hypothetical protein
VTWFATSGLNGGAGRVVKGNLLGIAEATMQHTAIKKLNLANDQATRTPVAKAAKTTIHSASVLTVAWSSRCATDRRTDERLGSPWIDACVLD